MDHFSLASLNKRPQLEAVLNRGIGVNAKDVNGQTFLHHAAKNGAVEVLRWLIANPKIMLDSQVFFSSFCQLNSDFLKRITKEIRLYMLQS